MIWCGTGIFCFAQQKDAMLYSISAPDSTITAVQGIPAKFYAGVDKKISHVAEQLSKKTLKYLRKFQQQEEKLRKRLREPNPGTAINKTETGYSDLFQKIKSRDGTIKNVLRIAYNPFIDSLCTALSFIKQIDGVENKGLEPLSRLNMLQDKLQLSGEISAFINERRNQIKGLLLQCNHLTGVLKNEYKKLSKTAYYYSAQVREYKDILKNRDKIERNTMGLLNKIPAFKKFMQTNSQLAQLFPMPVGSLQGSDPLAPLAGLQTRSFVQSLIQQRIASSGPNALEQLQCGHQSGAEPGGGLHRPASVLPHWAVRPGCARAGFGVEQRLGSRRRSGNPASQGFAIR